LSMPYTLSIEV